MSRYVTVNTAREVYRYKIAYHGDMFLHMEAVTIVNNRDYTLHYAIEEENTIPNFLQSVVEERGCYNFIGLIRIQKALKCFKLYGVYDLSVADLERTKKRVTPWSKRN